MNIQHILPSDIEKESFRIIEKELSDMGKSYPKELMPTIVRVIHTTADFEYGDTLAFSEEVIKKAKDAIRAGAHIVTDTNMALSGISKKTLEKYGGKVHCFMADEDVAAEAKKRGVTRAVVSMERAAKINAPLIFAIGNAPTALIRLHELIQEKKIKPALIIGVPVGFVNVIEAKEMVLSGDIPYIVNRGRKGGSTVAAAICNSLLYNMEPRFGFTTGSCAAAAAKAALLMILENEEIHNASVMTPKGIAFNAEILDIKRDDTQKRASCAVIKDGGDDPDVTTGAYIYAEVTLTDDDKIEIDGGEGVGRVTRPGLDRAVGEAAINSVPRAMISENLREVLTQKGLENKGARVVISVPGGNDIAKKTFNPKLGIVGGISILGTTGIVEPMSDRAILETIKTEINVVKAEGGSVIVAAPGNMGIAFLHDKYGLSERDVVMTSNFVYDSVKEIEAAGFKKLLFAGHLGKLIKVAGGIKNTHSMYGDHRMEILSSIAKEKLPADTYERTEKDLLSCVSTNKAAEILKEAGFDKEVFDEVADRIKRNLESWSDFSLSAEVIVFSGEEEVLAATKGAKAFLEEA